MIYTYFLDIFKCRLVYTVFLCVHILISNIYYIVNVYNRYYYKGKNGCKKMNLKTVLIAVLIYFKESYVVLLLNLIN